MLVVFLDFDGVINRGAGPWLRPLVEQLNRITDQTKAKIVVHSSWRWTRPVETLRGLLRTYHTGLPVTGEVLDACPSPVNHVKTEDGLWVGDEDYVGFQRGRKTDHERALAIQNWLDDHPGQVTRFVILDDSPDLGHFIGAPSFIRTQMRTGLTKEQADQAIRHLKGVKW